MIISGLLFSSLAALSATVSASSGSLTGTWSSKSERVLTGPGFYDPVDEKLIEPALPGISFSFTDDGYWEQAAYVVSSNPQKPGCPSAALTYQHGTYTVSSKNGSITMTPFEVDGRQLISDPCSATDPNYIRYNQTIEMQSYNVYIDDYHGNYRLDLVDSSGNTFQPLFLIYNPPLMLPTITLNPTASSDDTARSRLLLRRALERGGFKPKPTNDVPLSWWVASFAAFVVGTVGYLSL